MILTIYNDFNPHSHEGSDMEMILTDADRLISIHTPTKGVTLNSVLCIFRAWFQSTLPRREWPNKKSIKKVLLKFQSTLPRREWHHHDCIRLQSIRNFNPHSHEGSDGEHVIVIDCKTISIHTPTKGVTLNGLMIILSLQEFQSTLPRREWQWKTSMRLKTTLFQSTLPRREWLLLEPLIII